MKKFNLTVIATIIATFFMAMFAFQTVTTEASNNALPNVTPSPRKRTPINANVKVNRPRVNSAINGDDDWVRRPTQPRSKSRKKKH
jgi:uncharacterized protein (UPF0333 family)